MTDFDAYPDVATLINGTSVQELIDSSATEQESYRIASILAVEHYTGQAFTPELATTKRIDGAGGRSLYLPKRLESLTTLDVSNSGIEAGDVYISEGGDRLVVLHDAGIGNYYEKTMRELTGNEPLKFTFGIETVSITGDWGWSEIPEPILTAIRIDMEDQALAEKNLLSTSFRSYRALGIGDVSQGNLRAAMEAMPSISYRVQRFLDPYIWLGQVGVVI